MTKRVFEAFAAAIRVLPKKDRKVVAEVVASVCAQFNGRFDKDRFLAAAKVES